MKNMRRTQYLAISSSLLLLGVTAPPSNLEKKLRPLVLDNFSVQTYEIEEVKGPDATRVNLPNSFRLSNLYKIESSSKPIGFVYVGQGPSKTDVYDFAILFDTNLMVKSVKVLQYREDYGGEIASKRWLKQFNGSAADSEFVVGKNIAAISGATISVRSMTEMVNLVLKAVNVLKLNDIL